MLPRIPIRPFPEVGDVVHIETSLGNRTLLDPPCETGTVKEVKMHHLVIQMNDIYHRWTLRNLEEGWHFSHECYYLCED